MTVRLAHQPPLSSVNSTSPPATLILKSW